MSDSDIKQIVCACTTPWTEHPGGFRWETNGGDLRHIVIETQDQAFERQLQEGYARANNNETEPDLLHAALRPDNTEWDDVEIGYDEGGEFGPVFVLLPLSGSKSERVAQVEAIRTALELEDR